MAGHFALNSNVFFETQRCRFTYRTVRQKNEKFKESPARDILRDTRPGITSERLFILIRLDIANWSGDSEKWRVVQIVKSRAKFQYFRLFCKQLDAAEQYYAHARSG